jgi:hypothetical protein
LLLCQKAHERQKHYYQGAHEGNKKKEGETWGSIEIDAFLSLTLYFFPLFSAHPAFLTAP